MGSRGRKKKQPSPVQLRISRRKCYLGWRIERGSKFGAKLAQAIWPAAGIEAIHAYSLVHDDLPCMDDDDLRRGLPAVHRKWDDGTAVLVGSLRLSAGRHTSAVGSMGACRDPVATW